MTALLEVLVERPPAWQDEALCAQVDHEIFFPDKGGSTAEAKKVCAQCPVTEQCLQYALDHDERFGVWGGLSERQRRRLKEGGAHETERQRRVRERDEQILALVRKGLTDPQIAERLGLPGPHTACDARRRHGVPPVAKKKLPEASPRRRATKRALQTTPRPVIVQAAPVPVPEPPAVATRPPQPARPASRRRWADDELAAAVATLTAARFTPAEIAHELGVPVRTVRRCA